MFATTIVAFHFICLDRNTKQCSVYNLYPEHEGTFVLHHIPEHVNVLIFSQLMTRTVDHSILSNLAPTIKHVLLVDSAAVKNIIVPSNSTIERLFIARAGLDRIRYEVNDLLVLLSIEKVPLNYIHLSLANLRNLSYIKINHTPMEVLNLALFCHMRRLQTLDLNHNRIRTIIGNHQYFNGCGMLTEILLGNNRLTTVDPRVFGPFSRLQALKLSENRIHTISPGFKNPHVTDLELSKNMLSTFDLCDSGPMPHITTFYVETNKLIDVPQCLERMPNVEVLNLEHNQLTNVSIDVFKGLKHLQYLRLSWNPIVSFAVHEHSLPPGLIEIDVRNNGLEHLNISETLFLVSIVALQYGSTAFQFRCEEIKKNYTCTIANYSPTLEGTYLFNHVPNRTDTMEFKNLNLTIINSTLLSYLPPTVTTLSVSESSK
uniref:Leucine rich immune protein (Coil-less) n=1 Tax=Anopheles maculatus TaxID=74869 RepID=A0A182SU90_9DIPT